MKLIDADELKAYMQDKYVLFDDTLADIDAQPTVDAEPVRHGHNIREKGGGVFFCSVCGYINDDTWSGGTDDFNFCPNCGAKMDEVTEC